MQELFPMSILILLPFISIIFLNFPSKTMTKKVAFWLAAFVALLQVAIVLKHLITHEGFIYDPIFAFFSYGFSIDLLTQVALLSIGIVSFVSLLVARVTISDESQKFNFINLVLIAILGMNVISMTRDLFSTYIFIEVTAISSFILIALTKDKFAVEGAFKYIMLSAIASVLILSSIGLLLLFSQGTSFANIYMALQTHGNEVLFKLGMGMFLCGLFIKCGLVPFHGWLPDAYSSSSAPVSVLLAGIITKASGVYVLLRLVISVFGGVVAVQNIIMLAGVVSIIIGALLSLTQTNFKRLLSYSSISQVGYIILAAGCATPLAILGAIFHFFNHAIFKSLLFVNAAAVEKRIGSVDIDKMGGLATKMPITGGTSVIAFLSTAGIPPLSGFWSKLIIVIALWKAGNTTYAGIALLASIITLGYLLYLQRKVFFGKLEAGLENVKEVEFGLLLPQVLLAAIIIVVGLTFPFILKWL